MSPGRSFALLTLGAAAVLAGIHFVPSSGGLSHLDFVPGGPDALQFCDPLHPQFLEVVARASPVTLTVAADAPAEEGRAVRLALSLRTASGKPIGPDDLLETAAQKLPVFIVDPDLWDFHHGDPAPGAHPGEWTCSFTPKRAGLYRVFADFTPAATGREMYASADLPVSRAAGNTPGPIGPPGLDSERDSYRFHLSASPVPIYARQPIDLHLSVRGPAGGMVPLVPFHGSFVHLVAFDQARTGFVNLHAAASAGPPDPFHPDFAFSVALSDPGRYVVWGQLDMAGREIVSVPFGLEVLP